MNRIIRDLIVYYHSLKPILRETVVQGQGDKMKIHIVERRASQVWQIVNDRNEPDDKRAKDFLEDERKRVADQVYELTRDIVFRLDKHKEAGEWDNRKALTTHYEKISWSLRILMRLNIIDPFDKMFLSTVEKEGIPIGFKRKIEGADDEAEEKRKILDEIKDVVPEDAN